MILNVWDKGVINSHINCCISVTAYPVVFARNMSKCCQHTQTAPKFSHSGALPHELSHNQITWYLSRTQLTKKTSLTSSHKFLSYHTHIHTDSIECRIPFIMPENNNRRELQHVPGHYKHSRQNLTECTLQQLLLWSSHVVMTPGSIQSTRTNFNVHAYISDSLDKMPPFTPRPIATVQITIMIIISSSKCNFCTKM